jgi:hypothetical protein
MRHILEPKSHLRKRASSILAFEYLRVKTRVPPGTASCPFKQDRQVDATTTWSLTTLSQIVLNVRSKRYLNVIIFTACLLTWSPRTWETYWWVAPMFLFGVGCRFCHLPINTLFTNNNDFSLLPTCFYHWTFYQKHIHLVLTFDLVLTVSGQTSLLG